MRRAYLGRPFVVPERNVDPEKPNLVVPFVGLDDVGVGVAAAGLSLRHEHRLDGEAVEAGDTLTTFLQSDTFEEFNLINDK